MNNTGIATRHRNEHHHGQQLHAAGRGTEACNHPDPVVQAWRLAGWHDADTAAGNRMFEFNR